MIVPAISPVYGNNPGYGLLEIDDTTYQVDSLKFHWFQLEDYYRMGISVWKTVDLESELGVDVNSPQSVRDTNMAMLTNFQQFGLKQALKFGVPNYLAQGASFFWPLYQMFDNSQSPEQFGVICSNTSWDANSMSERCKAALGVTAKRN